MEMKAETFSLLPKWVRVIAGLFLVTIIITNIVAFIYIFFVYDILFSSNPPEIEIILSLSLAQISSVMIIGWVYLKFSWSQVSREVIMKQVSRFLENDIPFAIDNIYYYYDEGGNSISDIKVEKIEYTKNSTSAYYLVNSKRWGIIVVYIQVNIRIIEVIYHLEPLQNKKLKFDTNVKNSIEGAKTVNWVTRSYNIHQYKGPSNFSTMTSCETIMMKQVLEDDMFLLNTPKKIFWANDIAMMTKSFLEENATTGSICE